MRGCGSSTGCCAHDLDGVPYGHFGDGCVHVRIDFDFTDGGRRFGEFLRECALALAAHGGSLSGEHGDGRARSELLPLMYDARSLELFAAAKAVADPDGLLNPGVLVDPAPLDADLRPARPVRAVTGLRLVDDLAGEAHRCTGVGKCVSAHAPGVMCPSWQATRAEKDSTRGRARVLQEALDGDGTLTGLDDDAVAEVLDLCLSCKACATDCPTGVDMATLKSEVLHQRYAGPLGWVRRPRTHHTLGRLPALLDSPARRLLPLAGGDGALARLAKRLAGVDPRRSLPTPARTTLRTGGVVPGDAVRVAPDVWLWADTFTDHFAADAARAAVRFLEGAGLRAEVVGARGCCGLTYVSTGQLDAATRSVDALVAALAPYVATGAPVLGLEPSCLATLRSDVLRLASDPESARQVAAATVTFAELLTRHDVALPDLTGTTVVVQPHCHQYAVGGFAPDEALLRRTGATVVTVAGCCGLAGNFGVEQGHHDVSVAVAETHLLPTLRAHPDAVVLADGMSCRTQVEDLVGRQVRTLAELLAGA